MSKSAYFIELNSPTVPTPTTTVKRVYKYEIAQWGSDNQYPLFLNYLKNKCALHNGIIEGKIRQMYNMLPALDEAIDSNGISSNTIKELLLKTLTDYEIKNAFAIKVIKLLNSVSYEYVSIDNVRIDKSGNFYYICNDWSKAKADNISVLPNFFTTNESVSLAVFGFEEMRYFDVLENKTVYTYYPSPNYVGAIEAILTDIKISHFHHSEITNDFLLGAIVNFANGIPENEDEKREIINEFRKKVQDIDKQGGILVTFSNGQDTAPTVTPLNGNDLDTRYMQLSEDVQQRIIVAHGVTSPLIFGIKTSGQLGGATELEQAQQLFRENYVIPRLKTYINFINQVFVNKINLTFACCSENKGISEDEILKMFSECGIDKNSVTFIGDYYDFDVDSNTLLKSYQQFSSTKMLTALQDKVLSLLISGESMTTIAKTLNVDIKRVYEVMQELQRMKLLNDEYLPVKGAEKSIQKNVLATLYEYTVRPGLGEPIIETTRPFCRKMIELNKVYTRADIDKISQKVGSDVWYYRGGWYHDPRDNKNYPFCRHYWYQKVAIVDKSLIV